jgi:hypothetical protein
LYFHNRGQYAEWYPIIGGKITSIPFIEMVVKGDPSLKTDFTAVELNCQNKPNDTGNAMEFKTEQHKSYLTVDDFDSDELHDILYSSWIKNDSTDTGSNEDDTSNLFGEYMLAKYFFKQGEYNKLFGITVQAQPRNRLNTT